ncbi:MAG: DUF320 domain-containing protein [Actinomycetota bacterium]|nr:DUF320 domain-containing protein [Actinomycetota bacterium]
MRRTILSLAGSAALSIGLFAAPASAAVDQDGLVNVNLSDNVVQVPVAAAVNLCDVTVAILAAQADTGNTQCDAVADSEARAERRGPSNVSQEGLVNVNVSGNTIQVPVAVAANICDVDLAVLALQIDTGEVACTARAGSRARG